MVNPFTKHSNSVGETYLQHFLIACIYSSKLALASLCCLIHSIFPFLFQSTASQIAKSVFMDVEKRKSNHATTFKKKISTLKKIISYIKKNRVTLNMGSVIRINCLIDDLDDDYFMNKYKR